VRNWIFFSCCHVNEISTAGDKRKVTTNCHFIIDTANCAPKSKLIHHTKRQVQLTSHDPLQKNRCHIVGNIKVSSMLNVSHTKGRLQSRNYVLENKTAVQKSTIPLRRHVRMNKMRRKC